MKQSLKRTLIDSIDDDVILSKKPNCRRKLAKTNSGNKNAKLFKKKKLEGSTVVKRKSERLSTQNGDKLSLPVDNQSSKNNIDLGLQSHSGIVAVEDMCSKDSESKPSVSNDPGKWKLVSLDFHDYLLSTTDSYCQKVVLDNDVVSSSAKTVKGKNKGKSKREKKIPVINDPYLDSWIVYGEDGYVDQPQENIGLFTQLGVGRPLIPLIHRNIVTMCGRRMDTEITNSWAEFSLSTLVTEDIPLKEKLVLLPVVDTKLTQAIEDFNQRFSKKLTQVEILKGPAIGMVIRSKKQLVKTDVDTSHSSRQYVLNPITKNDSLKNLVKSTTMCVMQKKSVNQTEDLGTDAIISGAENLNIIPESNSVKNSETDVLQEAKQILCALEGRNDRSSVRSVNVDRVEITNNLSMSDVQNSIREGIERSVGSSQEDKTTRQSNDVNDDKNEFGEEEDGFKPEHDLRSCSLVKADAEVFNQRFSEKLTRLEILKGSLIAPPKRKKHIVSKDKGDMKNDCKILPDIDTLSLSFQDSLNPLTQLAISKRSPKKKERIISKNKSGIKSDWKISFDVDTSSLSSQDTSNSLTQVEIVKKSAVATLRKEKHIVSKEKAYMKNDCNILSVETDEDILHSSSQAITDPFATNGSIEDPIQSRTTCKVEEKSVNQIAYLRNNRTGIHCKGNWGQNSLLENPVHFSIPEDNNSSFEGNSKLKPLLEDLASSDYETHRVSEKNPMNFNIGEKVNSKSSPSSCALEENPLSSHLHEKSNCQSKGSQKCGALRNSMDSNIREVLDYQLNESKDLRFLESYLINTEVEEVNDLFEGHEAGLLDSADSTIGGKINCQSGDSLTPKKEPMSSPCGKKLDEQPKDSQMTRLLGKVPISSHVGEKIDHQFKDTQMRQSLEEEPMDSHIQKKIANNLEDDLASRPFVKSLINFSAEEKTDRLPDSGGLITNSYVGESTIHQPVSTSLIVTSVDLSVVEQFDDPFTPITHSPMSKSLERDQSDSNMKEQNDSLLMSKSLVKDLMYLSAVKKINHHLADNQISRPVEENLINSVSEEQCDDPIENSNFVRNTIQVNITGEQIDHQPESDHHIDHQSSGYHTHLLLNGLLTKKFNIESLSNSVTRPLVDDPSREEMNSQSQFNPLTRSLMADLPGEVIDFQLECSPVTSSVVDDLFRKQINQQEGRPASMSLMVDSTSLHIGKQFDCQFERSPTSTSLMENMNNDNDDPENSPMLTSLLEAFGESDELDENLSNESSDDSLDSEIVAESVEDTQYIEKAVLLDVKKEDDVGEGLTKDNIKNLPVEHLLNEEWIPEFSLPPIAEKSENRNLIHEGKFEPKLLCKSESSGNEKRRIVRRFKEVPIFYPRCPCLRDRTRIREKMASDEWYFGNGYITPHRTIRGEHKVPLDWNKTAQKKGFKQCWVVLSRVWLDNIDDSSSSSYVKPCSEEIKLKWFEELARGKIPDELLYITPNKVHSNPLKESMPTTLYSVEDKEESPGDHIFGFRHCTRTYGLYLDYVSRNRSFLYAYKMRRTLKFQQKNNKHFQSSQYCKIQIYNEDPCLVDVETDCIDITEDMSNSSSNPLEMIPMPHGNMFGIMVIKEVNSANELPMHFVDSSSLKRGVNYKWLILMFAGNFNHVVVGKEHVLSAKLLFDVMYRADLTKKLVCNKINEESCDEILKFGVYGIPGICNIVLLGPYPLNENFPIVQRVSNIGNGEEVEYILVNQEPFANVYYKEGQETVRAGWWESKNNHSESQDPKVDYLNFLLSPAICRELRCSKKKISIGNLMADHLAKSYVSYHRLNKESNFLLLHDLLDTTLVEKQEQAKKQRESSSVELESWFRDTVHKDSDSSYSVVRKQVRRANGYYTVRKRRGRTTVDEQTKHITLERLRRKQLCYYRTHLRSVLDEPELTSLVSILSKSGSTIHCLKTQERILIRQKVKLRRCRRNLANRCMALLKGQYVGPQLAALKKKFMPDFTAPRRGEDIERAFKKQEKADENRPPSLEDSSSSSNSVAPFHRMTISKKSVSPVQPPTNEGPIIKAVRCVARSKQHPSLKYGALLNATRTLPSIRPKNSTLPVKNETRINDVVTTFSPAIFRNRIPFSSTKVTGKSVSLVVVPSRASAKSASPIVAASGAPTNVSISSAKCNSSVITINRTVGKLGDASKFVSSAEVHREVPPTHETSCNVKYMPSIGVVNEVTIENSNCSKKSVSAATAPSRTSLFDISTEYLRPVIIKRRTSKKRPIDGEDAVLPVKRLKVQPQLPPRRSQREKKRNKRFYESPERNKDVISVKKPLRQGVPGSLEAASIDHTYSRRTYKYLINDDNQPLDDPSIEYYTKVNYSNRIPDEAITGCKNDNSTEVRNTDDRISIYLLENEKPITKLHVSRIKKPPDSTSSDHAIKMNHLIQILLETLQNKQRNEQSNETSKLTHYLTILESMLLISKNKAQVCMDSKAIVIVSDDDDNIDFYENNTKYSCRIVRSAKEPKFSSENGADMLSAFNPGCYFDKDENVPCPPCSESGTDFVEERNWCRISDTYSDLRVGNKVVRNTMVANMFNCIEITPKTYCSSNILFPSTIDCSVSEQKPVTGGQNKDLSKHQGIVSTKVESVEDSLALSTSFNENVSVGEESHHKNGNHYVGKIEVCETEIVECFDDLLPDESSNSLGSGDATCYSGNESDHSINKISVKSFASLLLLNNKIHSNLMKLLKNM